jgi:hypothetical protein
MALAVAEMYWLRMLFKELRIPLLHTPCLWVDNIGALSLSQLIGNSFHYFNAYLVFGIYIGCHC